MMQLSVSNIAWQKEHDYEAYSLLSDMGINWIELAPARIANWDSISIALIEDYLADLQKYKLSVSSLQGIFFGKKGISLTGEDEQFDAFLKHVEFVAKIADTVGCKPGVFGAPLIKLRGEKSKADLDQIVCERLKLVGETIQHTNFILSLEPVPSYYGADYLTSTSEILAMLEKVNHPNIGLHLDIACVQLGEQDISSIIKSLEKSTIKHFHISEPDLKNFSNPIMSHRNAAQALRAINYDRFVTIEMKAVENTWKANLQQAITYCRNTYFGQLT
ncbi:sugar phosphate isomerase/epimerase family protein [Thioclava sp. GXIMD4215]|uniref:sugar phosphate isomerase/epimerase family protein n=1 Tax=Thioclava sp. GXIMD4215 TaxID=3131928 RepID=UPI00324F7756